MAPTKPKATHQPLLRIISTVVLAALLALPSVAQAESVKLPKKGMQYFTLGLSLNPGFLYDGTAETRGVPNASMAAASMAQIGVTQIVTRTFYMSAEGQLGLQWLNDNTAAKDGSAPSSTNFAWQLGLLMNWLPLGEELGFVTTGGIQLFQAHLDDAPLQILGGELRVGRYIWTEKEEFLLIQAGYTAPFIQGLDRPTEFGEGAEWSDRNWSFHRFSIGFQYGF